MSSKKIELSIIITAHNEGEVAHATMLSIFKALKPLRRRLIKYEIIVNIDKSDLSTEKYFSQYEKNKNFTILKSNFGDPGLSRNKAIKAAQGKYVAVLDADDIISSNWYICALKAAKKADAPILFHPEANFTFGTKISQNVLWPQRNSYEKSLDAFLLSGVNRWDVVCLGLRDIFIKHPYPKSGQGYGHEDYYFNMITVADGIKHKVIKNTIKFYRREEGSVLSQSNAQHVIQPYTKLFDLAEMSRINSSKDLLFLDRQTRPNSLQDMGIKRLKKILLKEWQKNNKIEPKLDFSKDRFNNIQIYDSEKAGANCGVGESLVNFSKSVTNIPDCILIITANNKKGILRHIKNIHTKHPKWHIAVILTQDCDKLDSLPKTDYIYFYKTSIPTNTPEYDLLLSRLITQLQCKILYILGDKKNLYWVDWHKELIKKSYEIKSLPDL